MAQDKKVTANRTYKSSVFTMVFQEKKELLELYNAVSGKHYEDPEELEIIPWTMPSTCPSRMIYLLSLIPGCLCMNTSLPIIPICPCAVCFMWRIFIPK